MKQQRSSFSLLRLLSDGDFHSGEALAGLLGCTRGAVWYRIRDLDAMGLRVFKVRGRGYRLSEPVDLIDVARLCAALGTTAPALSVDVVDECDSTNASLMQGLRELPSGRVLICEHQRAGRGRRGNRWVSGVGAGLTFSLLWRFSGGTTGLAGLSLAVAVVVARALASLGLDDIALKWPNDLLHHHRKFGGILIEVSGEPQGPTSAVIGIGINVRLPLAVAVGIDRPVTDLASIAMAGGAASRDLTRTDLLIALLREVAEAMPRYERDGFAAFRAEWLRRHAHAGSEVAILQDGRTMAVGVACGVGEDGALLLRTAQGEQRIHSGEVSLRPTQMSASA